MNNLVLFVNEFLSYALVFVIFVAGMIAAGVIGVSVRKKKNAKAAETEEQFGNSNFDGKNNLLLSGSPGIGGPDFNIRDREFVYYDDYKLSR